MKQLPPKNKRTNKRHFVRSPHQASAINSDPSSREVQNKLLIKTNCKECKKLIQKFKLRQKGQNKVLKEFHLCVDCWKKEKVPPPTKDTAGALFDTISTINMSANGEASSSPRFSKQRNLTPMDHYIFDGTYGWMVAESKPQPTIKLRMYTNKSDYDHMKIPYRHVNIHCNVLMLYCILSTNLNMWRWK